MAIRFLKSNAIYFISFLFLALGFSWGTFTGLAQVRNFFQIIFLSHVFLLLLIDQAFRSFILTALKDPSSELPSNRELRLKLLAHRDALLKTSQKLKSEKIRIVWTTLVGLVILSLFFTVFDPSVLSLEKPVQFFKLLTSSVTGYGVFSVALILKSYLDSFDVYKYKMESSESAEKTPSILSIVKRD